MGNNNHAVVYIDEKRGKKYFIGLFAQLRSVRWQIVTDTNILKNIILEEQSWPILTRNIQEAKIFLIPATKSGVNIERGRGGEASPPFFENQKNVA